MKILSSIGLRRVCRARVVRVRTERVRVSAKEPIVVITSRGTKRLLEPMVVVWGGGGGGGGGDGDGVCVRARW